MRREKERIYIVGSGRPRYIGTLAIFSSMHTSTGMSRMHSAVPRAAPQSAGRGERGGGGDARQWKMHAPRYTTCASKLQLQRAAGLGLSLSPFFFRLSLLVSLIRPPPRRSRVRLVGNGLLNNSLCGLAGRCVCACIDAGLFREIARALRCHPPRVTTAETLFRCIAATAAFFRFRLVETAPLSLFVSVPMTARGTPKKRFAATAYILNMLQCNMRKSNFFHFRRDVFAFGDDEKYWKLSIVWNNVQVI